MFTLPSNSGISQKAAINRNSRSSDKSAHLIIHKPKQSPQQVFRLAEPPHWCMHQNFFRPLCIRSVRMFQKMFILFRQKEPRGNRIDANPDLGDMHSQPFREVFNSRFSRTVRRHFRHRPRSAHRGNINDGSPSAHHLFEKMLRWNDSTENI